MKLDDIQQIAVIGLGRMGHGIAQSFAMAGYSVVGFDSASAARESARQRIASNLDDFVRHELIARDRAAATLAQLDIVDDEAAAVSDAQFIVEAIAEDVDVKRDFFGRIESVTNEHAILASNSSTFTVSDWGRDLQSTQRAIVTHWFNPPHIVPTVEVVPGPQTTDEVTETTLQLHRKIGKLAVRINAELPGFLVNRVQVAMIREVWDLYQRGVASAEDIDTALRGSLGFRLAAYGPLAICDFGGVDIWSTVYRGLAPHLRGDAELPPAIAALVEAGRYGTRSGAGIHDYSEVDVDELNSQRDGTMLQLAKLLHSSKTDAP